MPSRQRRPDVEPIPLRKLSTPAVAVTVEMTRIRPLPAEEAVPLTVPLLEPWKIIHQWPWQDITCICQRVRRGRWCGLSLSICRMEPGCLARLSVLIIRCTMHITPEHLPPHRHNAFWSWLQGGRAIASTLATHTITPVTARVPHRRWIHRVTLTLQQHFHGGPRCVSGREGDLLLSER